MKTFAAIVALGAALAVAQDISSLPPCGQTCINNMIQIATSQFGCPLGDVACYCTHVNFGYGVRDCSNEACPSQQDANQVIQFGTNYCANVAPSAGSTLPAVSTGALPVLSSALASASAATTASTASNTTSPFASATASATNRTSSATSSAATSVSASASSLISSILSSASSHASSHATSPTQSPAVAPKMTGLPVAGALGLAAAWLLV